MTMEEIKPASSRQVGKLMNLLMYREVPDDQANRMRARLVAGEVSMVEARKAIDDLLATPRKQRGRDSC
jgi:hypothetical protein